MTPFSLGTFEIDGSVVAGLVLDDVDVVALEALDPALAGRTVLDLLEDWPRVLPRLRELAETAGSSPQLHPVAGVRVLPPHRPPQIIQAGANFREHVMQMAVAQMVSDVAFDDGKPESYYSDLAREGIDERARSGEPYVFLGAVSSVSSATDEVLLPAWGVQHDWEIEMAAVIGTPGHDIAVEDALDHVAGWTIANDLSTRDLIFRRDISAIGTDWFRGKNAPTFLPVGPWIVPAERVADPQDVRLRLWLNGELMQDGNTSDMVFDFARLISYASRSATLLPGDLVLSGSPAGNGAHFHRFLRDGDVIDAELAGLGRQHNVCRQT